MSLSGLAYASLETAFNHYLGLDPVASARMAELHGKVITFELIGTGQTLYMIPGPGQLTSRDGLTSREPGMARAMQVLSLYEGEPDCTLRGTPLALAAMSRGTQSSSDSLFSGDVAISGDTQLAHQFGKILGAMDVDWEEQLSRYTGDMIAHELGNLARTALHWGRRSLNTLGQDLQEYLQAELRMLPEQPEIEQFLQGVDRVRDDVERLEIRLDLLKKRWESNK